MAEDLYTGFGNQKILAERAKKDINGNSLELTIENEKVTAIGGVSIGGGSEPVDAYTKAETNALLDNKQDTLAFDGTYDSSTNKVATVSTVANAISGLSGCNVSYDSSTGELHLDFSGASN